MTESQLTRKVMLWLRRDLGCFPLKLSDRWTSGIPDIVVTYKGRTVWIELKTGTGRLSDIQKWTIDKLIQQGSEVHVCRSLDEVRALFSSFQTP